MDPQILREAMTAYQAVYDEDLRETIEFENWVNSLLEEGYDLSDYTWEDMYEAYIEEVLDTPLGFKARADRRAQQATQPPAKPQSQMRGLSIGQGGFRINNTPVNPGLSPIFQRPGARPPAPTPRPGTPATSAAPRPATSAAPRPATSAAPRPATSAAPRPGTTPGSPKPGPTATATATATPKPRPKDTSITDMIGRSQVRQGAPINTGNKSSDLRAMQIRSIVGSKSTTSPKPAPAARPMGSRKPGSIVSGFDMFDVVKGHLLDEGYADTEEAALAIMANMSEEWRQSIIEGGINFSVPSRTDDFNNRRDELKNRYKQDVGPRIPGPGGGGQYGEPPAPKAMGLRLAKAKGTSNSKNA